MPHAASDAALHQRPELLRRKIRISQDTPQHLGVENRPRMVRNGDTAACGVLVDLVTAALTGEREAGSLQRADGLGGGDAGKLRGHTATPRDVRVTISG